MQIKKHPLICFLAVFLAFSVNALDADNDLIPDALEVGDQTLLGTDADGDGIDDIFDVDTTSGVDVNLDGIDDAFTLRDTDGDGIPDDLENSDLI